MIILLCILVGLVLSSMVEGIFHQFVLHTLQKKLLGGVLKQAYVAHALQHHPEFRDEQYVHEPEPKDDVISLGLFMLPSILVFFSPLIVTAWWLWGWGAGVAFISTLTGYYVFYEFLHWNVHFPGKHPKGRLFRRFQPLKAIFNWFDKRHFIHHLADDRNYNVVLPLYDLVFGTYTTHISRIPWAIRVRTKRNIRRAQRLRAELRGSDG